MPLARLRRAALLACAAAALLAATAHAGAVVESDGLVFRADGGFEPQKLPRRSYAPIRFQGHIAIAAQGGGRPAALQQAVVEFDRDGRLSVAGLPSCAPEQVIDASTEEARRICQGAIVGSGQVEAIVALASGDVRTGSPLTIFNGPAVAGHPTAVVHAQITVPATQTFAIEVPIEKRRGEFRYRATLEVPPIAGGLGAITGLSVKIGRRYSFGGKQRSYVSARCSDSILRTHGRFTFEGGMLIDGSVEKFCHPT